MSKAIWNEKRSDTKKHINAGESKENTAKWLFISVRTVNRVSRQSNSPTVQKNLTNSAKTDKS